MSDSRTTPYSSDIANHVPTDANSSTGPFRSDAAQGDSGLVRRVRERATAQLSTQKDKATETLGSVARVVRESTQQLRNQQQDVLAGYAEQAADQIERLSRNLRDKDIGELLDDAQRLARRQPALFIGSAFAIGVIGARFLKSSNQRRRRDEDDRFGYGRSGYGRVSPEEPGAILPPSTARTSSDSLSSSPRAVGSATESAFRSNAQKERF
jgi:hypothetical protein